jgi:hypothetical protein
VSRLRGASKAPLAIGGILAVPLFFVALLAFALKLDKPSHGVTAKGASVLGDPTKGTLGSIYLLAVAVAAAVVLTGAAAIFIRSRLVASSLPAAAAIVASVLLLLPLGTWAAQHTKRYPLGVDNIPRKSPEDLSLRGEWEQSAKSTARQIGFTTIGMAVAAIALTAAFEVRRRRGRSGILVEPPPIELGTGGAPPLTGG